jgi:hypothetical protein
MKWFTKLFSKRPAKPTGLTVTERHAFWSSVYDNDPPELAAARFIAATRKSHENV